MELILVNNNKKRFIFFELGVIYEIGRLLLRDNTPFSDEIKNTIKEKDRQYKCSNCGHTDHRDLVGAKNIIHAPVLDGHSQVA